MEEGRRHHREHFNSLGFLREEKTLHASSYLSGRPRPSLVQIFSSNKLLLPKKSQYHHKEGTLVARRKLQERSTTILSIQHNLHASYLLADYQQYFQWYVYIFLLKVFSLLSLEVSYFFGSFGTTVFACTFYTSL